MITILLSVSRTEYLRAVFNCLAELEKPSDTELLIITDGDSSLQRAVDKRLDSINYTSIKIINFGNKPEESIDSRRYRISAIHNKARHYISEKCDYVFLVEDDGTYDKDALSRLMITAQKYTNLGSVSGVQVGRHSASVVGVWYTDNVDLPREIGTLPPSIGTQEVDATGMYLQLTKADLYKSVEHKPFGDEAQENLLGPDVNYGIELRKRGFNNYVDWQVSVNHLTPTGELNIFNTIVDTIIFKREGNIWQTTKRKNLALQNGVTS